MNIFHLGKFTQPEKKQQKKTSTLTSRDGRRPGQPVVKRIIAVVEPVLVSRAGQPVAELDDVADLRGRDRLVGRWVADRRCVVKPVAGAILVQVARNLDRQVRRSRYLWT